MTHPKTIIELANRAGWIRPEPGKAAVLIIDAQNEYLEGPLKLDGMVAAMAEVIALRSAAAVHGWPVVHIRHKGGTGSLFDLSAHRGAFIAGAEPAEGEAIVTKTFADSFAATDLHEVLERLGVKQLIIAGFMTHNCVSSTVRRAVVEGYKIAVLASATATRALPLGDRVVSSTELQAACLAGLGDTHAAILSDTSVL